MSNHVTKGLALLAVFGLAACGGEEREEKATEAVAQSPPSKAQTAQTRQQVPPSPLEAEVELRDLGDVPIDGGLVETEYLVRNAGGAPAGLAAAYTSCMCTEVVLEFDDGVEMGPFGMPGHDRPVTLERWLEAGESFTARATFDPMAHGPEAVGPVRRIIALHTDNGGVLELGFDANVVKEGPPPSEP